jgi:hypothetical protein
MVNEKLAIEMVDLMFKSPREKPLTGYFKRPTLGIEGPHPDSRGALDLSVNPGNREAAFLFFDPALAGKNFGIDEYQALGLAPWADIDNRKPDIEADLGSSQTHPPDHCHGGPHIPEKPRKLLFDCPIINGLGDPLEHGLAMFGDPKNPHERRPLLSLLAADEL